MLNYKGDEARRIAPSAHSTSLLFGVFLLLPYFAMFDFYNTNYWGATKIANIPGKYEMCGGGRKSY